jgi:hypothetical protein
MAAILAGTAMAGFLPGESILLGLLSSDALLDFTRAAGAVLLGRALLRRNHRSLRRALIVCGAGALSIGCFTLLTPHGAGLLPHGVSVVESVLTIAFGALALTTTRVSPARDE